MSAEDSRVWDLAVVGGGTAGIVGARTAAALRASVVLIEQARTGGDCLWTGCVPSKALLAAAGVAATARRAGRFGVTATGVEIDFPAVMTHVHGAIATIEPVDSVESLESYGITVIAGTGRFATASTLDVAGTTVRFRRALLATGSGPSVPHIDGLAGFPFLTSDNLWDLPELPQRLVVLGGGSIGCELGQAFARLGAEVTVIEAESRVLPHEDAEASAAVATSMVLDGVMLSLGHAVVRVEGRPDGSGTLTVDDQDPHEFGFDRLLVAVGRTPRTGDMGLDHAGIDTDSNGFVVVGGTLRTSNRRVWAAGDITGHPQLTHLAGVHASMAASNAVLGLYRRVDPAAIPRVTFTDPEVAAVGVATGKQDLPPGFHLATWQHDHVDRAVVESDTGGFARLALDASGRLAGATVVGPRAGETLAELTLAVRKRLRARDIAGTTHAYPTYADGVWNAAIKDSSERLRRPVVALTTAILIRATRVRSRIGSWLRR